MWPCSVAAGTLAVPAVDPSDIEGSLPLKSFVIHFRVPFLPLSIFPIEIPHPFPILSRSLPPEQLAATPPKLHQLLESIVQHRPVDSQCLAQCKSITPPPRSLSSYNTLELGFPARSHTAHRPTRWLLPWGSEIRILLTMRRPGSGGCEAQRRGAHPTYNLIPPTESPPAPASRASTLAVL